MARKPIVSQQITKLQLRNTYETHIQHTVYFNASINVMSYLLT